MALEKTTPGSYEAPVEGIVDYGSFRRGFKTGFAPGLAFADGFIEAEKEQKEKFIKDNALDQIELQKVQGGEVNYQDASGVLRSVTVNEPALSQMLTAFYEDGSAIFRDENTTLQEKQGLNTAIGLGNELINTLKAFVDYDSEDTNIEAGTLAALLKEQDFSVQGAVELINSGNFDLLQQKDEKTGITQFGIKDKKTGKFLDLTYKLNATLINGSKELNGTELRQKEAVQYGTIAKGQHKEFENNIQTLGGDQATATIQKRQYVNNSIVDSNAQGTLYYNNHPEHKADAYNKALTSNLLTPEMENFIYGSDGGKKGVLTTGFGRLFSLSESSSDYQKVLNQYVTIIGEEQKQKSIDNENLEEVNLINSALNKAADSDSEGTKNKRSELVGLAKQKIQNMKDSIGTAYTVNVFREQNPAFLTRTTDLNVSSDPSAGEAYKEYISNKRYYNEIFDLKAERVDGEIKYKEVQLKAQVAYPSKDYYETTAFGEEDTDDDKDTGSGSDQINFQTKFLKDFTQNVNLASGFLLEDPEKIKIGKTLTGNNAPKMTKLLNNKTIGGAGNLITDFTYEITGYRGEQGNLIVDQEKYDALTDEEKNKYTPQTSLTIKYNRGEKTDSLIIKDITSVDQLENAANKIQEGEVGTGAKDKAKIRLNQAVQQVDIEYIDKIYGKGNYSKKLEEATRKALANLNNLKKDQIRAYVYGKVGFKDSPTQKLSDNQKEKLITELRKKINPLMQN